MLPLELAEHKRCLSPGLPAGLKVPKGAAGLSAPLPSPAQRGERLQVCLCAGLSGASLAKPGWRAPGLGSHAVWWEVPAMSPAPPWGRALLGAWNRGRGTWGAAALPTEQHREKTLGRLGPTVPTELWPSPCL